VKCAIKVKILGIIDDIQSIGHSGKSAPEKSLYIFTREYTKCTAGSTFCFVVVVLVVFGKPLIKLASISADS
jgi:hypothetical protein